MRKLARFCCVMMIMAALIVPAFAADETNVFKALTATADGEKDGTTETSDEPVLTTGTDTDTEDGTQAKERLPFEIKAPKYVFADRVSKEGESQEINVAFSKDEDMMEFFKLSEEAAKDLITSEGLMTVKVSAQIDWAIDDPEAWHADASWDTDGKNAKGDRVVGEWAYVDINPDGNRLQSVRIFTDFGNTKSKDNKAWNGSGTVKGWKDIIAKELLASKGTDSYYINWNAHTLYVRVRYYVYTVDNDEGLAKNTYLSDWSETVSVGLGVAEYDGYGMESDLPVPVLSGLTVDDSDDEVGPVIVFDAQIDEAFTKNALQSEVYGGVGHLVFAIRLRQEGEWRVIYRDAVSGKIRVPVTEILEENEIYSDGDAVEVYGFAWIDQYSEIGGIWYGTLGGSFSETLKYGITDVEPTLEPTATITPEPSGEPTPEPTGNVDPAKPTPEVIPTETVVEKKDKDVCPVCHQEIDPQILGFCMIYWGAAILVLLIIIVIIVKAIQRKRDEETDILFR